MGIIERREREKEDMRNRIIDAAMEMFTTEGYEAASIRKIADKIEYSPATIYLYYKDKDELLYDVQAECFDILVQHFKKAAIAKDPYERLQQICTAYVKFGWEHPEMYDLMFTIKAPMNKVHENDSWKNADDTFGCFMRAIHECMELGLLRFDNIYQAALSIWSFGHGLVSLHNSCRMTIMQMSEEQLNVAIINANENYLKTIKK